ncbi:Hypothetical protein PHPALM_12030 [Phytophthora palmivora]|uniref:Integrase catalytic domain-containing protein n=1 Tax=Phytophthora palmivora TaxID=4796 RepID=A0A2P4Y0U9_9STRA|nr:Hypothetical protein PHPALM_12030 [Phytophthora palmivora]
MVTGEDENNVTFSIKSSVESQILVHLAHYVLRTPVAEVTEEALRGAMERKAGNMMNDHVPDVAKLFAEGLKMALREPDIEARVPKYFMDFDRLVEDQGLATWVGRGEATDVTGRQRMKTRCRLLIDNLLPEVLRIDVGRLVNMAHRGAKADDVQLYDMIVERVVRQQHYHLMQAETKKGSGGKTTRPPPRDGCLIYKGPHRAMECPTATSEQKDEARQTLATRRAERPKHVGTGASSGHSVTINGVLEVPICANSGAESNILSRSMVDELCALDSTIKLVELKPPTVVKVAGGATMQFRDHVEVDLRISTAAGPLNITRVGCLALVGDEGEFLLGRATVKDIGIDVNGLLEQLAGGASVAETDNDDVTEHEPELGYDDEREEIHVVVDKLVDEAVEAGFEPGLADDLRVLVHEYEDVWRLRIGADEPARVEPMRITLRPNAQPYRSGVRKYPDMQRAFLRIYAQDMLDNGLVCRNNSSRWVCAALPVRKIGGDGFRITVDYRPVNKLMFDLLKGFWQLPLMEECPELLRFVTEDGVFTPLRVPEGASDSAMHFQLQMHECFQEMLYDSVLVWVDNVMLFSTNSIVDYARTVDPLQAKLEKVMATQGRRKSQPGAQKNWSSVEQEAYPIVRACIDLAYLLDRELGGAEAIYPWKAPALALKMVGIRYVIGHKKDTPTSIVAATAILDWYKRFGLPKEWISDNGSHFKAQVMEDLAGRLQASQKFVPVYTPWVNGTVKRVNRDLLQVSRVMLLELQLDTRNWHYLLPVIQAN